MADCPKLAAEPRDFDATCDDGPKRVERDGLRHDLERGRPQRIRLRHGTVVANERHARQIRVHSGDIGQDAVPVAFGKRFVDEREIEALHNVRKGIGRGAGFDHCKPGGAETLCHGPARERVAVGDQHATGIHEARVYGRALPIALAGPGYWLQLGAFRERDGAFDFQRKVEREVEWLTPLMAVFTDRELHRLQAGPYASRADAAGAAEQVRNALQLVPLIVERR